jgi:chemotaxis protein methyltransferase CheR
MPQVKSSEQSLTMENSTFCNLRDVIYKSCGIYFNDSKKYLLEGRVSKRLNAKNLKTFEEYIAFLQSPYGRQELNQLFEVITINETYFFRAEQQFDAFEKILVPEIIKSRTTSVNSFVRIWSAACSTGEEPYTLAIIILERLKYQFPNIQFQILATDINKTVLESAKQGIFKEYSVRNVPSNLMAKYFKQSGNTYQIKDEVKNLVKFIPMNLYDTTAMKTINNCDIIFCCNVLIYFDIPSKQQVVSQLYDSLNRGGYLFIGYSESLHGISKAFKLIHLPQSMAYKKE